MSYSNKTGVGQINHNSAEYNELILGYVANHTMGEKTLTHKNLLRNNYERGKAQTKYSIPDN